MFKKKSAASLLCVAASLGMLAPAYADVFDNTWYEARITAMVKKGEGFEKNTPPPYRTTTSILKADSGIGKCYVYIAKQIERSHEVVTLCKGPAGWQKTHGGKTEKLDELELSNDAIAFDATGLYFAANNQSYQDSSIDFLGEIIIKPILGLNGNLLNIQLLRRGMFYVYDNSQAREVYATTNTGTLSLNYTTTVPDEVSLCLNNPMCI